MSVQGEEDLSAKITSWRLTSSISTTSLNDAVLVESASVGSLQTVVHRSESRRNLLSTSIPLIITYGYGMPNITKIMQENWHIQQPTTPQEGTRFLYTEEDGTQPHGSNRTQTQTREELDL